MMKLVFILISILVLSALIITDTWNLTVIGFGYEVTASLFLFLAAFLLLQYLLHIIKQPLAWIGGYRHQRAIRKLSEREAYLLLALKTTLDHNEQNMKQLLKQRKSLFATKSDEYLMLEALFAPTPYVFEQLLHRNGTEVAGIRGLMDYARKTGDLNEVSRLLQRATVKAPNDMWIRESLWTLQTLQNDWADALETLDVLKKNGCVNKAEYAKRKSVVLLKLGQVKESFKLDPTNPATAIAYAKATPDKARDILINSWAQTPCWDTYLMFRDAIKTEKTAKQIRLTEKLVAKNKESRLSLLALAQAYTDVELWGEAKEILTSYLNAYPLTPQVAHMMAMVERNGWHHEESAIDWEHKAANAQETDGWGCSNCNHKTNEWHAVCPVCNTFGSICYK